MAVETRTIPVISTAHIKLETLNWMDATPHKDWPMGGGVWDYGYLLYAHDEPPEGTPAELAAIYDWAIAGGWNYILLDCDADTVEGLATYPHS